MLQRRNVKNGVGWGQSRLTMAKEKKQFFIGILYVWMIWNLHEDIPCDCSYQQPSKSRSSKLYVELEFTFGPMIGEFFAVPLLAGLDKPNLKKTSMKLV